MFVFLSLDDLQGSARDVITDFERGVDTIDLTAIDAIASTRAVDEFDFIGASRFSDTAGELRRTDAVVEGDVDGDGVADFRILLQADKTPFSSDFML